MSDIIYLKINGAQQGAISAGCGTPNSIGNRYQLHHQDEIFVFSLQQGTSRTPVELEPRTLTFCKMLDKSSPLLMQAINNNESLTLSFDFWRINRYGRHEKYYHIELRGASVRRAYLQVIQDAIDQEYISVDYDYIRCRHLIAGTEFYWLVTPDNYNKMFTSPAAGKPVKSAEVVETVIKPEIVEAAKKTQVRKVTLTLGIFFDGTGNNAVNTQNMLEACTAQHFDINAPDAASILARTAKEQMGVSGTGATSYTGYHTNIHWMNELYETAFPSDSDYLQRPVYIEGIGTRAGEPDSALGLGLGISDTGVIAKTDDAVKALPGEIAAGLAPLAGEYEVVALQFDIFGFSRGAAAARHFANRIQQQDSAIISAVRQGMKDKHYSGAPAGKTRFLGLFDTVTAVGTPLNGLNPHSADTGEVNIRLRPGVADRVFQITAAHECRFNFALNSVRPGWPELTLPGAHSDIGGGYLPQEREDVFLTRPQAETVPLSQPDGQSRVYRQAIAQLRVLEASPVIAPFIRNNPIAADVWADERMPTDRYGQMQKRSFAALTMRKRIVRNDWSKVALRVMIAAAEEAGVLFIPMTDSEKELYLPADLSALNAKAIAMGQAVRRGRPGDVFSDEEVDLLAARYLHCSANWNAIRVDEQGGIQGGMSVVEAIGFVNRPDENWLRTVYTMEGKKK